MLGTFSFGDEFCCNKAGLVFHVRLAWATYLKSRPNVQMEWSRPCCPSSSPTPYKEMPEEVLPTQAPRHPYSPFSNSPLNISSWGSRDPRGGGGRLRQGDNCQSLCSNLIGCTSSILHLKKASDIVYLCLICLCHICLRNQNGMWYTSNCSAFPVSTSLFTLTELIVHKPYDCLAKARGRPCISPLRTRSRPMQPM